MTFAEAAAEIVAEARAAAKADMGLPEGAALPWATESATAAPKRKRTTNGRGPGTVHYWLMNCCSTSTLLRLEKV